MEKRTIGIGLMGLGVIGGGVAKGLIERAGIISEQTGCPVELKKIKVLESDLKRPIARELDSKLFTLDEADFFNNKELDIIIELIGGEKPAYDYLKRILTSGKHAVTANKEVIAKHGVELMELAHKHKVSIRYEASVGGGIPLIAPFQRDLVANRIKGVYAIINGTTNYILTRMARENMDFTVALSKAQELGYAEANPTNDVEGIDAVYKLAILASLAFHHPVKPQDIYREGISRLNSSDFRYAKELGYAIKLLAIAKERDGGIEVRVHPVFIPEDSLLAKVNGVYNAILVEGDLVGRILFFGQGAGSLPTSSAVLADVASAARSICQNMNDSYHWKTEPGKNIKPIDELETRYYVRLKAADKPGVLAQVSTVLGDNLISIHSVIQKETSSQDKTAEIVLMTYPAQEQAMQKAIKKIAELPVISSVSNFIRVEYMEEEGK